MYKYEYAEICPFELLGKHYVMFRFKSHGGTLSVVDPGEQYAFPMTTKFHGTIVYKKCICKITS